MPINPNLLPYALFQKSKTLLWDPQAIALVQDKLDWARMNEREREIILQLSTLFLGGEESVTHDLAPMLVAVVGAFVLPDAVKGSQYLAIAVLGQIRSRKNSDG